MELAAELQLLPVEPTDPEVDWRQPSAKVAIESPCVATISPATVEVEVVFNLEAAIPPLNVEVELLLTLSDPKVLVAAKRLVEEAVVAKKFVEVAELEVELTAVKF